MKKINPDIKEKILRIFPAAKVYPIPSNIPTASIHTHRLWVSSFEMKDLADLGIETIYWSTFEGYMTLTVWLPES